MRYIQGEGRNQGTLFPVVVDDFVPADHVCRVIDAFVEMLVMSELGFERAQAAETGRPGSFQYAYGYDDRSNDCPHLAESAYTLE
jgi:transposase